MYSASVSSADILHRNKGRFSRGVVSGRHGVCASVSVCVHDRWPVYNSMYAGSVRPICSNYMQLWLLRNMQSCSWGLCSNRTAMVDLRHYSSSILSHTHCISLQHPTQLLEPVQAGWIYNGWLVLGRLVDAASDCICCLCLPQNLTFISSVHTNGQNRGFPGTPRLLLPLSPFKILAVVLVIYGYWKHRNRHAYLLLWWWSSLVGQAPRHFRVSLVNQTS